MSVISNTTNGVVNLNSTIGHSNNNITITTKGVNNKVPPTSSGFEKGLVPFPNVSVGKAKVPTQKGKEHSNEKTVKELQGGGSNSRKEKEQVSLNSDLRNIMHAFGDGPSPLDESVELMELILKQEMMAFVFLCDAAGHCCGTKALGLKECIYTLRNDKPFLGRLFKYLIAKDLHQRTLRGHQKTGHQARSYFPEIKAILNELDGTGEMEALLDFENGDKTDTTSNMNRLISPKYLNFARARSVSFARKLPQLQEWVALYLHSEFKLTYTFLEVLAFLIYDFVSQIVDLCFVIKRECSSGSNALLQGYDIRGSNPDTCMAASLFLRKDEECNISEILVLASELEAKRFKKLSGSDKDRVPCFSVNCLTPSDIRIAYTRMQQSQAPSVSFRSRAEKLQKMNFQY